MTSQWARWRLKSPASRLLIQQFIRVQIKENIKAPRHWPLWGNSPVAGEFPSQMANNAQNVSIWWRHHDNPFIYFNPLKHYNVSPIWKFREDQTSNKPKNLKFEFKMRIRNQTDIAQHMYHFVAIKPYVIDRFVENTI